MIKNRDFRRRRIMGVFSRPDAEGKIFQAAPAEILTGRLLKTAGNCAKKASSARFSCTSRATALA
jgi:hypothetical protein